MALDHSPQLKIACGNDGVMALDGHVDTKCVRDTQIHQDVFTYQVWLYSSGDMLQTRDYDGMTDWQEDKRMEQGNIIWPGQKFLSA